MAISKKHKLFFYFFILQTSLHADPAIVRRMNCVLNKIKRDGLLNALKQRYLAEFKHEQHT
ncbi:hypothetical protein ACFQNF_13115 [Iodobacter arcticus]|uniref:Solute-binding protein family 3/N-terminal domain-containing protein n=1 Tax=Iodobacter arcticus TaxID=590593 RepID=A0ABW2QZA4_9NEIS